MYYTGTKIECEDYDKLVTIGEDYRGSTLNWADVITHKDGNRFAIIKHDNYNDEMDLIELTSEWYD